MLSSSHLCLCKVQSYASSAFSSPTWKILGFWVGVRRMGPNSFQWCPVTGQGATGTNWRIGSSIRKWGRTSLLWGWQSPGTGCPEGLWIVLLWRYSRPTWARSRAACSRWPCLSRLFGLDDPQRSLPTANVLWFCEFPEQTARKLRKFQGLRNLDIKIRN